MVDVVGAPIAIISVTSDRANETPDALVNIQLEKNGSAGDIQEPVAGIAEVSIVDNIIAQVTVSGELAEPEIEEESDFEEVEGQGDILTTTTESSHTLSENEVLILIIERQFVVPAEISIESDFVSDKGVVRIA